MMSRNSVKREIKQGGVCATHYDGRPELLLLVVVQDEEHEPNHKEDPNEPPDPSR